MAEEWRRIPSFPEYEASSLGRIRSRFRVRKLSFDKDGYLVVGLARDGEMVETRVNVLVCEAFHGPKKYSILHAAHKNGIKTSNRPTNLRWATPKSNSADMIDHGTRVHGEKHHRSLFTWSQIGTIRKMYMQRPTGAEIARLATAFDVAKLTIRNIVTGKSWVTPQPKKKVLSHA